MLRFLDQTTTFLPREATLNVPEERTGLLFVFRAFDRVSYAILLNTTDPVTVGDVVRQPVARRAAPSPRSRHERRCPHAGRGRRSR